MLRYHGHDGWPLYAAVVGDDAGPTVVVMHGGGPDHHSLVPLADRLADRWRVVLPDVRGYGRSACPDPDRHTWARYADDVVALLDHLDVARAVVGGTGLGSTVAARALLTAPDRFAAGILISIEDIEDDEAKAAEERFMARFAATVRADGVEAAWAPVLPNLAPVIEALVRDAIPRSDRASVAAAAAIGQDRSFRDPSELAAITVPTLIFPGMDERHPTALAEHLAGLLPAGRIALDGFTTDLRTAEDLAGAVAPAIRDFLADLGPTLR